MEQIKKVCRRHRSWLLLFLCFVACQSVVQAQGYYDAAQRPDGEGTKEHPYELFSMEHFLWIAQQVNSGNDLRDEYFAVTQDIDFSDTRNWDDGHGWRAIGGLFMKNGIAKKLAFRGHLEGNNHVFYKLYGSRPDADYQGLFGYVDNATIKNLHLRFFKVEGSENVGALSGYTFESNIENIRFETDVVQTSHFFVGGAIGYMNGGYVKDCSLEGAVEGVDYVGGLLGWCLDGLVTGCRVCADVKNIVNPDNGEMGRMAGGLVAYLNKGRIEYSGFWGNIEGGNQVGGLVGDATHSKISDSFVSYIDSPDIDGQKTIKGQTYVGGLVGKNEDTPVSDCFSHISVEGSASVGGLIGSSDYTDTRVVRSYAACAVKAEQKDLAGGFIGTKSYSGSVDSCYYDKELAPELSAVGGYSHESVNCEGKTTAEMKQAATYAGWNFASYWLIDAKINDGYPYPNFYIDTHIQEAPTVAQQMEIQAKINGTLCEVSANQPLSSVSLYSTDGRLKLRKTDLNVRSLTFRYPFERNKIFLLVCRFKNNRTETLKLTIK